MLKPYKIFGLLANEIRYGILRELAEAEKSVSQLVSELEYEQPAISHSLRDLSLAGLVQSRRKGKFVFYSLRTRRLFKILRKIEFEIENLK